MLDEIRFSERGDRLTAFEVRLLVTAATPATSQWLCLAHRLVSMLGPEAGATAFAEVLDEFGTEKIHVPARRHFFVGLWRRERDALIRDMACRDDWTHSDIARLVGVSPRYVRKLCGKRDPGGRQFQPGPVEPRP